MRVLRCVESMKTRKKLTLDAAFLGDVTAGVNVNLWASPGTIEEDFLDHVCRSRMKRSRGRKRREIKFQWIIAGQPKR